MTVCVLTVAAASVSGSLFRRSERAEGKYAQQREREKQHSWEEAQRFDKDFRTAQ